jgi:hypothetical protein
VRRTRVVELDDTWSVTDFPKLAAPCAAIGPTPDPTTWTVV